MLDEVIEIGKWFGAAVALYIIWLYLTVVTYYYLNPAEYHKIMAFIHAE